MKLLVPLLVPLLAVVLLRATTAVGQYCDGGPNFGSYSTITRFQGPGLDYSPSCPSPTGINDQTQNPVVLQGGKASIMVSFGSCSSTHYEGSAEIWIDWDKDGDFDFAESVGSWSGKPPQDVTFNLVAPPEGFSGITRGRIVMRESASLPLDPCSSYLYGAAIDFSVVAGSASGGGGDSGGLSGGSILLIILVVVIPVYIVAGCVYNRKKRGTTGMIESCPQNDFWCAIPGLSKEGCIYTNRCCLQPLIGKITGKSSSTGTADYEEL